MGVEGHDVLAEVRSSCHPALNRQGALPVAVDVLGALTLLAVALTRPVLLASSVPLAAWVLLPM